MSLFKTIHEITRHECSGLELRQIRAAALLPLKHAPSGKIKLTPDEILKKICTGNDVTIEQLRSKSRQLKLVFCRWIAIKHIFDIGGMTEAQVAAYLNRNHSTCSVVLTKYENELRNTVFRTYITKSGFKY